MENDLISRSAIVEKLRAKSNEWRGSYTGDAYATAARMVSKEPAVDAVEVCRCKDCKYYETAHSSLLGEITVCTGQGDMRIAKKPTDFCSYGERRAGDV